MAIKEGYSIMSFDYSVAKTTKDCLFNVKRGVKSKEARMAKEFASKNAKRISEQTQRGFMKAGEKLAKQAIEKLPPLDIGGHKVDLNDPNLQTMANEAYEKL